MNPPIDLTPNVRHMNETANEVEFERLLAEFTERVRAGESPSIDDYLADNPEYRDQIESLFPVVGCLEKTRQERANQSRSGQRRWRFAGKNHLGDYELVREIGRGGMGVVFEARQRSLDRKVALKVLPAEQAMTPASIARFQREARMAAQLHHSHIVPVLGHGEDDGNHFIAMQLIDGVGLNRIAATLRNENSPSSSDQADFDNTPKLPETSTSPSVNESNSEHSNDDSQLGFAGSTVYENEIVSKLFPDGY